MKRILCMLSVLQLALAGALWAQIQNDNDVVAPTPKVQGGGGLTPYFWIGIKTVFSGGYNLQTGAYGFRNYGGDSYTYASFNVSFVDSHYDTPKVFEVPGALDPNAWTGRFKLLNFTSKINSWSGDSRLEERQPAWLSEITGHGAHIGFLTQAGWLIGSLADDQNNDNKPITSIIGGNKVLSLGDDDLGDNYYDSRAASHATTYKAADGAIMYAGYAKPELFNAYLTMLSEGNVNSDVSKGKNDAFAFAVDFAVTPFGLIADDQNPLTVNLSGNFVGGTGWENTGSDHKNMGYGLKGEAGVYLGGNLVLAPALAYDGRLKDDNAYDWKIGGGLKFQFSGMRWVEDEWNELVGLTNQDFRYENNKMLKYAYGQIYAAYSETTDLDMVFKVEEPDGSVGISDKLGAMAELRMYNLTNNSATKSLKTKPLDWMAQGRVSYDLNVKAIPLTPSLRAYLDSDAIFKMRIGVEANPIPYTSLGLSYMSANLNRGTSAKYQPNKGDTGSFDAGRIEFTVMLQSDNVRPRLPKRMEEWGTSSKGYPTNLADSGLK